MTETLDPAQLITRALKQLRNAAGQLITPVLDDLGVARLDPRAAGTAGRLVVAPGQTVSSAWGNTTFDQTVVCFANAADRTAQWPAPHEGSVSWLDDQKRLYSYTNGAWAVLLPRSSRFKIGRSATGIPANAYCDVGLPANTEYYTGAYVNGTSTTLTFLKACLLGVVCNWGTGGTAAIGGWLTFISGAPGSNAAQIMLWSGSMGGGSFTTSGAAQLVVGAGETLSMQIRVGTATTNLNASTFITCTDINPIALNT